MSVGKMGLHFKVTDFTGFVNIQWHSQNEVGNIGILVFWKVGKETLFADLN